MSALWNNPQKMIWGFHVHQELPLASFPKALVIQERCSEFLSEQGLRISRAQIFRPGYGPHIDYMWELRVEQETDHVLPALGIAASFMAVNRFGLSGLIHPLMHDPRIKDDLQTEGRLNQANILWFGYEVKQNQNFFFNPPKDARGSVVDTRTPNLLPERAIRELRALGEIQLKEERFQRPEKVIVNGFHIHLVSYPGEETLAREIFDECTTFLATHGLSPSGASVSASGWEIKLETPSPDILRSIGIAIGWLMCNRRGLSVMLHPVIGKPGETDAELQARTRFPLFLGNLRT